MIRNGRMQYDETKKNVCMLARKFPGRAVASSLYILSELPQESESEHQFISHKACPDYNCRKFGCMIGPLFQPCASGGRAQWQHPHPPFRQAVKQITNAQDKKREQHRIQTPQLHKTQTTAQHVRRTAPTKVHKRTPEARGPLLRTLHRPIRLRPLRLYRFLLLILAIPALLHRGSRPSHVGTPQEVKHRRAAPFIRQKVTDTPPPISPS